MEENITRREFGKRVGCFTAGLIGLSVNSTSGYDKTNNKINNPDYTHSRDYDSPRVSNYPFHCTISAFDEIEAVVNPYRKSE